MRAGWRVGASLLLPSCQAMYLTLRIDYQSIDCVIVTLQVHIFIGMYAHLYVRIEKKSFSSTNQSPLITKELDTLSQYALISLLRYLFQILSSNTEEKLR
jgi:hypothetical protein